MPSSPDRVSKGIMFLDCPVHLVGYCYLNNTGTVVIELAEYAFTSPY